MTHREGMEYYSRWQTLREKQPQIWNIVDYAITGSTAVRNLLKEYEHPQYKIRLVLLV